MATVMRNQPVYDAWRPFARQLIAGSSIDLRHRELLILRIAWVARSEYEWGNHVLVARHAGLSDAEIAAVRTGAAADPWSPMERALLSVPDQLYATGGLDDEVWEVLHRHYSDDALVEMVLLVGHYLGVAFLANVAGVEREPGVPGFDQPVA